MLIATGLLTAVRTRHEDVTLGELGFDAWRHPKVDPLVGNAKIFAVGDNQVSFSLQNSKPPTSVPSGAAG